MNSIAFKLFFVKYFLDFRHLAILVTIHFIEYTQLLFSSNNIHLPQADKSISSTFPADITILHTNRFLHHTVFQAAGSPSGYAPIIACRNGRLPRGADSIIKSHPFGWHQKRDKGFELPPQIKNADTQMGICIFGRG